MNRKRLDLEKEFIKNFLIDVNLIKKSDLEKDSDMSDLFISTIYDMYIEGIRKHNLYCFYNNMMVYPDFYKDNKILVEKLYHKILSNVVNASNVQYIVSILFHCTDE